QLLARLSAVLGPSLIPIGAVGIPAVTGLASSLGFGAVAAGTMIASLYGLGDALKALNKYAVEPTDANLEKLQQTMGALGPDAQSFVLRLREMGPALKDVRAGGAGELLP